MWIFRFQVLGLFIKASVRVIFEMALSICVAAGAWKHTQEQCMNTCMKEGMKNGMKDGMKNRTKNGTKGFCLKS